MRVFFSALVVILLFNPFATAGQGFLGFFEGNLGGKPGHFCSLTVWRSSLDTVYFRATDGEVTHEFALFTHELFGAISPDGRYLNVRIQRMKSAATYSNVTYWFRAVFSGNGHIKYFDSHAASAFLDVVPGSLSRIQCANLHKLDL